MRLTELDLNLLVAFEALLETGSVTAAASRIGVTQSAMSHALRRMRDAFDDELFVRAGARMVPTPRAEALALHVAHALGQVRAMIAPDAFDPATSRRRFDIGTTDMLEVTLLPALMARLQEEAPGVQLATRDLRVGFPAESLRRGEMDLALAGYFEVPSEAEYPSEVLYAEDFVCLVREAHPLAEGAVTLDAFLASEHMMFTLSGDLQGSVDRVLAESGLARRVRLGLNHFASAGAILVQTDLLLTCPRRLAEAFCRELPLVLRPLPVEIPGITMRMYGHRRSHRDPAVRWLRGLLAEVARTT